MKKTALLLAIATAGLCSCEKDATGDDQPFREYKVSSYQDVEITGNVVVDYQKQAADDEVTVEGDPELINEFEVRTEGNVLYLEANSDAGLDDSVRVVLGEDQLDKIILNAQQRAVIHWEDGDEEAIEEMEIETRGGSQLWFYGLRAEDVKVDMKGNSEVYLDSRWEAAEDSLEIPRDEAQVAGNLVIWGRVVVRGTKVETTTRDSVDLYVVYGDDIEQYYLVNNMEVRTTGNTTFNADRCAVEDMDIALTGNSEAEVWVLGTLSGEGQGSSVLNYHGSPVIKYNLSGSAVINLL